MSILSSSFRHPGLPARHGGRGHRHLSRAC